jgi:hypothetical protein
MESLNISNVTRVVVWKIPLESLNIFQTTTLVTVIVFSKTSSFAMVCSYFSHVPVQLRSHIACSS